MATNDRAVIKREALLLMRILNVNPKDLRGVGIQINKLEKSNDVAAVVGQSTNSILNFMTKNTSETASKSSAATATRTATTTRAATTTSAGTETSAGTAKSTATSSRSASNSNNTGLQFLNDIDENIDFDAAIATGQATITSAATATSAATTSAATSSRIASNSNSTSLQSLNDIDENILKELPEDIRLEIENERKKLKIKPQNKNSAAAISRKNSSTTNIAHSNRNNAKEVNMLRQEDLSFSQIDESVIAELPEDIIQELKKNKPKTRQTKLPIGNNKPVVLNNAFDTLMAPKPKLKLTSPAGGKMKKRGRPAKNDPKFIKKSVKTIPTTSTIIATSTPIIIENKEIQKFRENKEIQKSNNNPSKNSVKRTLDFGGITENCDNIVDNEKEKVEPPKKKIIQLNGKSDLKNVRILLREWIRSCKIPTEEDISTVIEFLVNLINDHQEDYVYCALKTLCNICQEANHKIWSETYNNIVQKVQNTFQKLHNGKKLYIPI